MAALREEDLWRKASFFLQLYFSMNTFMVQLSIIEQNSLRKRIQGILNCKDRANLTTCS